MRESLKLASISGGQLPEDLLFISLYKEIGHVFTLILRDYRLLRRFTQIIGNITKAWYYPGMHAIVKVSENKNPGCVVQQISASELLENFPSGSSGRVSRDHESNL